MSSFSLTAVIAAALPSALIGAIAWSWRNYINPWLKRKRRRAVLGFDVDESAFAPTIVVESTRPSQTSAYLRPTVGYGAVLAVANISQLIGFIRARSQRHARLEVWMDTDQIAVRALSEDSQHAIVIGGPLSNRETRRYLDHLNNRIAMGEVRLIESDSIRPTGFEDAGVSSDAVEFVSDPEGRALVVAGHSFRARLLNAEGTGPVTEAPISGLSGTDYGLIIRGPARNQSGREVVVAGVHTFGLAGASRLLVLVAAVSRVALGRDRRESTRVARRALAFLSDRTNENAIVVVRTDFECGVIAATVPVGAWAIADPDEPDRKSPEGID
jgi:hypothetical protein